MTAFDSYVDAARGRPGGWRILVGALIIGACWILGTFLVLFGWTVLQTAGSGDQQAALESLGAMLEGGGSPPTMAVMLLTFCGVWIGVVITTKVLHGHPFFAIFAPTAAVRWGDFLRGIALSLAFTAPAAIAAVWLAEPVRTELHLGTWLIWFSPLVLLIFVQATAEELIFRGYLLQQLAILSRNPAIWAGIPSV